jgi:hypothetical protein
MTTTGEQRAKPSRTVRLVRDLTDEVGVICLSVGKETTYYTVREIPCEIGGRGFAIHKLGLGTLYHVRVGEREDCSCECMGFLRHGYCKHVLGLLALVQSGKMCEGREAN